MRTYTLLFSLLVIACTPVSAQKLIAVHHQGIASYHTDINAAYNAAVNGDTMYLPGGSFNGFDLNKSLTLIGVGYHPDSTSATGPTILSHLSLGDAADDSYITGIFFTSHIGCYGNISGVTLSRCFLNQGIAFFNNVQYSNWIISENWINISSAYGASIYLQSGGASNFLISNNVIKGYCYSFTSSEISNNIFLNPPTLTATYSIVKNNVFISNYANYSNNCQGYNNLNAGVNGGPDAGGNTGANNYLDDVPLPTVFVNYSTSNTFFQNDFHVINPAYLGNDGTPVGIYGGVFPWKEGGLPSTPHIRAKIINASTNPDGTLHINVVVKAQDN
ncbi:MAG: hypothetical protein HUU34_10175 [Saprospiraceae bacterium]|nr:hypothetical protein [Saprospiraceae bacterium]